MNGLSMLTDFMETMEQYKNLVEKLDPESRVWLFNIFEEGYCRYCGRKDSNCKCERDD